MKAYWMFTAESCDGREYVPRESIPRDHKRESLTDARNFLGWLSPAERRGLKQLVVREYDEFGSVGRGHVVRP